MSAPETDLESDPVKLLWLRSGRCHHRSGQRHSLRLRQDLYLFKDRRSQQPTVRQESRVRSLLSAIRVREKKHQERKIMPTNLNRVIFTEEMRKDYTILCPQMSPIHFDLLEPAFRSCGYNFEVLDNDNRHSVDIGLKYVNNDACYPSLCVVGQIMDALLSGKYDLHKVAVVITQTGGGCRATNYIGFIRRALEKPVWNTFRSFPSTWAALRQTPDLNWMQTF